MPLNSADYRAAICRYQEKNDRYVSPLVQQAQLSQTATSQDGKAPRRLNPVSLLYLSTFLLPNMLAVRASAHRFSSATMTDGGTTQACAVVGNQHFMGGEIAAIQNKFIPASSTLHVAQAQVYARNHHAPKQDGWGLPTVSAAPVGLPADAFSWDSKAGIYSVSDASLQALVIANFKDFLIDNKILKREEAEDLELSLRMQAAGTPLLIAPTTVPVLSRQKRVNANKFIADHVTAHCAFEAEILDTEGENQGKVLLFKAQRAENPFRMVYDNRPNSGYSIDERGITDGLNLATDIWTVGLKPLVGHLIANHFRKQYYRNQGDKICAERQNRLTVAEIATTIDVSGLSFRGSAAHPVKLPRELQYGSALPERASYYARNKKNGVHQELLLKARDAASQTDHGNAIYVRRQPNGEFKTYHPDAQNPALLERRVIMDDASNSWRYADRFDKAALNLEIEQGKSFIKLYGNRYELHMGHRNQYEIVVKNKDGGNQYHPVYMEPLSKTWHLTTENKRQVYRPEECKRIERIKVRPDTGLNYFATGNLKPEHYGTGQIFEVRQRGQDIRTNPAQYRVVEMNGELLPVEMTVIPGHGVRYHVRPLGQTEGKMHPITWDGNRWVFERETSSYLAKGVSKKLSADMFADHVNAAELSSVDHQGLRWHENKGAYLFVGSKKLKLSNLGENRYVVQSTSKKESVYLRYNNGKYDFETLGERMQNLLEVGLSGGAGAAKKIRSSPLDTLSGLPGYDAASARALLDQYTFPSGPAMNEVEFVRYIEMNQAIPSWAEGFLKHNIAQGAGPAAPLSRSLAATKIVVTGDAPITAERSTIKMGLRVGQGEDALVYLDADAPTTHLYKLYKPDPNGDGATLREKAVKELSAFHKYYGEAELFFTIPHGFPCIRMYKVPGQSLATVPLHTLPSNAIDRFFDMLGNLHDVGLIHADLHSENVFWDTSTNTFFPIDLGYTRADFDNANQFGKADLNKKTMEHWDIIVDEIKERMIEIPERVRDV